MPQLDTTTFTSQIFWLVIAFLLLFAVVRSIAAPRLTGMAGQRTAQKDGDFAAAEAARAAEKAKVEAHAAKLAAAQDAARHQLAAATDRSRADAATRLATLSAHLKAEDDAATAAREATRAQVEPDLKAVADDVANDLVRRLTGAAV